MCRQATIMTTIQDEDALTIAYMYGVRDASKRIKLLEQRIIDLQGHDDLSYIDRKLPKGYAIVPIEPTESMIDAGFRADSDAFPLKYIYQAMIEAAQEGE